MSAKIKKPNELTIQACIKALIYGPPGIGKSTLGLSAPDPLYIDCDRGVHRISPLHQKDTIEVECWEDVTSILTTDLAEYKTLVIDTTGKMLGFMNDYLGRMNSKNKQPDGTLTQKGYGVRKMLFIEFLGKVAALGKHIVFVAHDKEDKKGDVMFARPDVGGSSGQDLIRELDLVGYIEPIGDARTISFESVESHYGKNTCGLPAVMNIPILTNTKNNFLSEVFKTFADGVELRQKMGMEYKGLLNKFEEAISGITGAKQANETYKEILETPNHVWDSLYILKSLVGKKAKELKLIANKETMLFEDPTPAIETMVKEKYSTMPEIESMIARCTEERHITTLQASNKTIFEKNPVLLIRVNERIAELKAAA